MSVGQELQCCLQAEAKLQHDWIAHLHDRWFSHAGTKGPEGLRLSDSLEQTLWAAAMVGPLRSGLNQSRVVMFDSSGNRCRHDGPLVSSSPESH
jgi:hypothetical protein